MFMKKVFAVFMALLMIFGVSGFAMADEEPEVTNVRYPSNVSFEMTDFSYWTGLCENPDEVLLSLEEIEGINSEILSDGKVNNVVDLETVTQIVDPGIEVFDRELYINGDVIDEQKVVAELKESVEVLPELLYAVTVKRANLKAWPMNDFLGYTENDPDDELQNTVLEINSPVVISEKSNYHGHTYYYCQSEVLYGWINSEELAICHSKDEWLESWKVDIAGKDFLVVCEDKIVLEPMLYEPSISNVELRLGARLKLVPASELPEKIGEREEALFNYAVYIPTRDEEGYCVRKVALIPIRHFVSVGYLPFTQSNLTKVAFELLGNRYGWGGMMNSYDSSIYNRQVYSCFGLKIPTNTTWQKSIKGYVTDISEMTEEEKLEYVKSLPIGTILYISGLSMQYIGCIGDMPYVIADAGVFSDSIGEVQIKRHYTVSILPMSTRKKVDVTFLSSLQYVLNFCNK